MKRAVGSVVALFVVSFDASAAEPAPVVITTSGECICVRSTSRTAVSSS